MKKTLATLLVVALVASLCGVMFVSAESANLVAGKAWTGDTDATTDYVGDLTDGAIGEASYDKSVWYGADRRKAEDDDTFTMIFDMEASNEVGEVGIHVWPAGISGIVVPGSIVFYASEDGETYTELGTVSSFVGTAPQWVRCTLDSAVNARYIKIDMVGVAGEDSGVFWFASEVEVLAPAEGGEAPEAPAETTLSVTHVNLYSWNAYRCQIITGEGNSCASYAHTAFDATEYVVLKVENVDGAYTVTAIEGAGVAKTLTAPADGFLLYCGNKDPDNFAIVGNVKVGDVVLANTVDLATDAASEAVIGTITFGSAAEEDGPGDAGVLVFAVLAVVAIAGCAVATKIKSSAL